VTEFNRSALSALISALLCTTICHSANAAMAFRDLTVSQRSATPDPPKGVGGCIFLAVGEGVRNNTLSQVLKTGGAVNPELRTAVDLVSDKCVKANNAPPGAVVGATLGTFVKIGLQVVIQSRLSMSSVDLQEAWDSSSESERAPFRQFAADFLSPSNSLRSSGPLLDARPIMRHIGVSDGQVDDATATVVAQYYRYYALEEQSEAELLVRQ
jgi:hypothetical protein